MSLAIRRGRRAGICTRAGDTGQDRGVQASDSQSLHRLECGSRLVTLPGVAVVVGKNRQKGRRH